MSTVIEYWSLPLKIIINTQKYILPSNISGALYHNVRISRVKFLNGIPNNLPNPKSAILI
jgi:hypothetical protein